MAILTLFFLNVVDQRVIIFDVFFVRVWLRLRLWGFGLWRLRFRFRFGIGLRCRWFWLWFRRLWLWGWRNVMCNITFMSFNA
jgi:hypothetical protein